MSAHLHPHRRVLSLDVGFRRDPSAGTVIDYCDDLYTLREVLELRPPPGGHLVPSVTLEALIALGRRQHCTTLAFDQHYASYVREVAPPEWNLVEAPAGMTGKAEMYTVARRLIAEGKVAIPAGQKRLLAQLRAVVSKPTSGGGISITSPRRGGSHGDIASSFVLGLWASRSFMSFDYQRALQTMRELGVI